MWNPFRIKKMTDQELRVWCVEQTTEFGGSPNLKKAKELYAFVSTSGESKAAQKKPRVCFFSRLWSRIRHSQK